MPTFKLVISDPLSGRAKQVEVKDREAERLIGARIGDTVDAKLLEGAIQLPSELKLKITGGSGFEGAPMLPHLQGPAKRYLLLSGPPGYRPSEEGGRRRKLVRGNTVSDQTVQINMVLVYPSDWKGEPVIKEEPKKEEQEAAQQ
ncbi:30S ribosomal protein S6e [Thermocladium modestius]|uniref:Small ribosomal subunit protein eS6 n=1 Tax=Thermocladium modestius TaxID=62609 RepID=A0A830GVF2_9CREN|nr:30S ribosomal protein S6e [Thermocladium modestius]GGP22163.1 30S ribosomal protein S6e [Thermocladium modestius]